MEEENQNIDQQNYEDLQAGLQANQDENLDLEGEEGEMEGEEGEQIENEEEEDENENEYEGEEGEMEGEEGQESQNLGESQHLNLEGEGEYEEGEEGAYIEGEEEYNGEEEGQEEQNGEEEEDLEYDAEYRPYKPDERKVRYILYKFINKMRESKRLMRYSNDILSNEIAKEFAEHYLDYICSEKKEEKEDPEKFKEKLLKKYLFSPEDEIKFSVFDSAIDTDSGKPDYNTFTEEFYDAQATLIEYVNDCENILNDYFNQVGIGLAFNTTRIVVVNVFSYAPVTIENCSISAEQGNLIMKGLIKDEKYGPYAMRIVKMEEKAKEVEVLSPEKISIQQVDDKKFFTGTFTHLANYIDSLEDKVLEVYIREKPESIPYGKSFSDNIKFKTLTFGTRVPVFSFPAKVVLKEEENQDITDKAKEAELQSKIEDYNHQKELEKKSRRNKEFGEEKNDNNFEVIKEEDDEDLAGSEKSEEEDEKKSKDEEDLEDKQYESLENADNEIRKMEEDNRLLDSEDKEYQNKIRILYALKKERGKEEKNFYKESNINESTYADSLSSASALYQELHKNKLRLDADLNKYRESISEQEKKKQEVYDILMEYKRELLDNAETRKGGKIPQKQIKEWLEKERIDEERIKELRIESFTKTLELNRLKKEFKKMEDYFEGLHIIDFEQLKIENNTLTEKIEDRNEEIHKLKGKITTTVQILAHLQEKSANVEAQFNYHEKISKSLQESIAAKKKALSIKKEESERKGRKQLSENKKIDELNSEDLKKYYHNTLINIESLAAKINDVSKELIEYRKRRRCGIADIDELLKRKRNMMEDYNKLPKIEIED